MARQKLVSLIVSAVCLAFFTIVMVKGMAARERRSFEASRALLDAGAQLVSSELGVAGRDLPETAERLATDADLGAQLKALSQQIGALAAMPKAGERMKTLVITQTTKVNDRLTELRGGLSRGAEVDAIAVIDEQGLVLLSDSQVFTIGNRVHLPAQAQAVAPPVQGAQAEPKVETITARPSSPPDAEPAADDTERKPADERAPTSDVHKDERVPVNEGRRVAPAQTAPPSAPAMDNVQTATVRSAVTAGPSRGAIVVDGAIVHLGAAPIIVKGKLAGIVVVERRLRSLPQPTGVDAVLAIDNQVRLGRAPEGASLEGSPVDAPFLLTPREVKSQVPSFGAVAIAPLFVAKGSVGIWARRFQVRDVPSAVGYVFTDVTPAFAELGGLQLMTVALAITVFVIQALLIAITGLGLMRGVAHISDFLGRQQQGLSDGSRLSERDLPSGLHRLARLVNKSIERSGAVLANNGSGRNANLDEVIALQDHAGSVPDMHELDFGGIATPSPEPQRPALALAPAPSTSGSSAPVLAEPVDEGSAALLASLQELSQSLAGDELPPGEPSHFDEGLPERTSVAGQPAVENPESNVADAAREAHYREVYNSFVETRETCGEPTNDLTYEKFTAKLAQSREAVMAKHACTDVRFQVYVKSGKAALKATPFK